MRITFKITAKRNRRSTVRYFTEWLYKGVVEAIKADMTAKGYTDIEITQIA